MLRLLPSLDALVKGGKASKDRNLVLKGVDSDIFWRFFQFVYCGAYKNFAPETKNDAETAAASAIEEITDRFRDSN